MVRQGGDLSSPTLSLLSSNRIYGINTLGSALGFKENESETKKKDIAKSQN